MVPVSQNNILVLSLPTVWESSFQSMIELYLLGSGLRSVLCSVVLAPVSGVIPTFGSLINKVPLRSMMLIAALNNCSP